MSQFPAPEDGSLSIFNPYFFDGDIEYLPATGAQAISYAGITDFNGEIETGQQLLFNDTTIANRFIAGLYQLQMTNITGINTIFSITTLSTNTVFNTTQLNSGILFSTTDGNGNNEQILSLSNSSIILGLASSIISFLGNNFDTTSSTFSLLSTPTSLTIGSNCTSNLVLGNTSGNVVINGTMKLNAIDTILTTVTLFSTPTNVTLFSNLSTLLLGKTSSTISFLGNVLNSPSSSFTLLSTPSNLTIGNVSGNTIINGSISITSLDTSNSSITLFSTPTSATLFSNLSTLSLGKTSSTLSFLGNILNSPSSSFTLLSAPSNLTIGNVSGNTIINGSISITSLDTSNSSITLFSTPTSVTLFSNLSTLLLGKSSSSISFLGNVLNSPSSSFTLLSTPTNVTAFSNCSGNLIIGNSSGTTTINGNLTLNSSSFDLANSTVTLFNTPTTITCFGNGTLINLANKSTTLNIATSSTSLSTINIANNSYNNNIYLNGSILGITQIDSPNSSISLFATPSTVSIGKVSSVLSLIGNVLNSTSTSFTLLNNPTSVVAFGGCSTSLTLSNSSGVTTIYGNSIVLSTSTITTNASLTTVFDVQTALTIGNLSTTLTLGKSNAGICVIRNSTFSILNAVTFTTNASLTTAFDVQSNLTLGHSATTLYLGTNDIYSTGICQINNANIYFPNAVSLLSGTSLANIFINNTGNCNLLTGTTSTLNFLANGSTFNNNATTINYSNLTSITGNSGITDLFDLTSNTVNFCTSKCSQLNIGYGGVSGSSNFTLSGPTTTGQIFVFPNNASEVDFAGYIPTITFGQLQSSGGHIYFGPTANPGNSTLMINCAVVSSNSANTSLSLFNTYQTTVNAFAVSTTLNLAISSSSISTITIANPAYNNNIYLNAQNVNTSGSTITTVNLWNNSNITTGNLLTGCGNINIGNSTSTTTINSEYVSYPNLVTMNGPTNANFALFNNGVTGNMQIGSTASGWGPIIIQAGQNVFLNAPNVTSNTQTAMNLFCSSQIITISAFNYCTTLNLAISSASSSTISIGNPLYQNTINLNAYSIQVQNSALSHISLFTNAYVTTGYFYSKTTTVYISDACTAISTIQIGTSSYNNTIYLNGSTIGVSGSTITSVNLFNSVVTTLYLGGVCSNIYVGQSSGNFNLICNTTSSVYAFNTNCAGLFMGGSATYTVLGNSSYANTSSQVINFTPASQVNVRAPLIFPVPASGNWTNIPFCMYAYQAITVSSTTGTGCMSPSCSLQINIIKMGGVICFSWAQTSSITVTTAGYCVFDLHLYPELMPFENFGPCNAVNFHNPSNSIGFVQLSDSTVTPTGGSAINSPNLQAISSSFSATVATGVFILGGGSMTYMCNLGGY